MRSKCKNNTHTCCSIEGCTGKGDFRYNKETFIKGLCALHYSRLVNFGDPLHEVPRNTCCKIEGCAGKGSVWKGTETFSQGYCNAHYKKLLKYGDPEAPPFYVPGVSSHPLYNTHRGILKRTTKPNYVNYPEYGGRGIGICERWTGRNGFVNFVEDMGPRPTPKHSIERIDNDKGYSPENCCWANSHTQHANKRNNSQCVGVNWKVPNNKWQAKIAVNGKVRYLGIYEKWEDTVKARKAAEVEHGIIYGNKI